MKQLAGKSAAADIAQIARDGELAEGTLWQPELAKRLLEDVGTKGHGRVSI